MQSESSNLDYAARFAARVTELRELHQRMQAAHDSIPMGEPSPFPPNFAHVPFANPQPGLSEEQLAEAKAGAERLGLTEEQARDCLPMLVRWTQSGYVERSQREQDAVAATPCESRRDDGCCQAHGCASGGKIQCALLARLATENCQRGHFGDRRAAVRADIEAARE